MVSIAFHIYLVGELGREGQAHMLLQVPDKLLKHIDDDEFPLPTKALLLEAYDEYLRCDPEKMIPRQKPPQAGAERNN